MHYQKGMADIKTDLQRKIVSYQTILKKTYAQAEKDNNQRKKANKSKDREAKETPTSLQAAQKRKFVGSSSAALEQRCQPSKPSLASTKTASQLRTDKTRKVSSKEKAVESLDQLKSAYFAKMQSLTKKLDCERVLTAHHRREDS